MATKKLTDPSVIFSEPVIKRILDKLSMNDKGCMEYNGYRDKDGYGHVFIGTREEHIDIRTHRWALGLAYGGVLFKQEHQVCHQCDNPACMNPTHLFLGTNQDNIDDKVAKDRAATVFGHAKLDWDIVDMIRAYPKVTGKEWTEMLGVAKSTVSEVKNNKIWRDEDRDKAHLPSK